MKNLHKIFLGGISALALTVPMSAIAQTKSEERTVTANDIIVTATRRSASVMDIPLSVTAYNEETLNTKGIRSIDDLSRITPGVTINIGFSGIKYVAIRGLQSSVGATMTGVYIDETPIQVRSVSLATNFYPAIFDLERIEVLRGPQGTLFGSGSMGGSIRFILPKPSLTEYSGQARGELAFTEGGNPSYEAGGAVGGPIIQDKIGFRASLYHRRDGGWVDRIPYYDYRGTRENNSNAKDTTVGNLSLALAPTENLTITPSVFYQRVKRHDTDQFWVFTGTVDRPPLREFTNGEGVASYGTDKALLYSLKAEYDLGPATIISNTAFLDRKTSSRDDGTAFFLDLIQFGFDLSVPGFLDERGTINLRMKQRSFTQELRLQSNDDTDSRFSYVLGLFYQNSRQRVEEHDTAVNPDMFFTPPIFPALYPTGLFPIQDNGDIGYALDKTRDKQYAAFGDLSYKLTDKLTVTAGVRVSRMKFDFFNYGFYLQPPEAGSNASGRTKETPVTPKFSVQYEPSKNLMLYATAAKGFRPGGANPTPKGCSDDALAALGLSEIPGQYKSDSVWSYELGAKGRLGRAATFAASVYNIDWTDIQRPLSVTDGCVAVFLTNLGKARSRGFDAQITLYPLEGLSFDIGVGYNDATQRETVYTAGTDTIPPALIVEKGARFSQPWVLNLAADYQTALGSGDATGYAHVQWDYKQGFDNPQRAGSNPVYRRINSQEFVSARLGVRQGPIDFSFFVNNLFNSRDILSRTNFAPSDRVLVNTFRPRTIGLTGSYRF